MLERNNLKEFGLKLKICRIKRGFTQSQLGEKVNISEHRISEIENGHCNITINSLFKLLDALDIDATKFFNL